MKKNRNESACFLAEGNKLVADILPHFECELLIARASWLATQGDIHSGELIVVEEDDIRKASLLKNPQDVIAVFKQPKYVLNTDNLKNQLSLMLDGIQDPGNLGTIIRIANWFGIKTILCSLDTADVFNPKTVQASMGALAHVELHYLSLTDFLEEQKEITVYGTFLDGENIYQQELSASGIIVMGNEGNGIRPEVEKYISKRLFIPNYANREESTESLNVSVATAVTCAEFRRKEVYGI